MCQDGTIPIDKDNSLYTVQEIQTRDIHQVLAEEMRDHDPSQSPNDTPTDTTKLFPHLPWIKHDVKVTLYLT